MTLLDLPATAWQVIVPLNAQASPLWFDGEVLRVSGRVVAEVRRVDADGITRLGEHALLAL